MGQGSSNYLCDKTTKIMNKSMSKSKGMIKNKIFCFPHNLDLALDLDLILMGEL